MKTWKRALWTGVVALALGWLAVAGATEAWARRMPEYMRRLDPEREPKTAARIEAWRDRLDGPLHDRYNFAWCLALVEGLEQKEYIAHSGVGGPEDLSDESWDSVEAVVAREVPPEKRHYRALCVNRRNQIDGDDCWDRAQDTEFKILEAITARLGNNRKVEGRVVLYTDLPPCASCARVIKDFMKRYPKIKMTVLYK